jgi:Hsp90 protein
MSPSLEKARSLGYEVLFMTEPLDELCAQAIEKFDGKVCMHCRHYLLHIQCVPAHACRHCSVCIRQVLSYDMVITFVHDWFG